MDIKEKMHSGALYMPYNEALFKEQNECQLKLYKYNRLKPTNLKKRNKLLREMFAEIGEGSYLEIPLYSSFGCKHCHFGKNVYANFGLTMIDDTHIYVGDNTLIGPNVVLATAGHPIDPDLRGQGLQYNASVHIGKNCWLGAGVVVVPGVTIGDNTVIGAGSIVTKDIPSGVVAVGNPCKVLREVSERDREYYFKDRKTPKEFLK